MLANNAWGRCLDGGALVATATATFKLLMLCGFVGWLLRSRRLPPDTSTTLSQVAALPMHAPVVPSVSVCVLQPVSTLLVRSRAGWVLHACA